VRAGDIEMFEEIQSLPEQGLRPCERVRRRQSVPNVGPVTVAAFVVSCRSR
jgi:hypothetical protein